MLNHDRMLLAFACILTLIFGPLLALAEEQTETETYPTVIISEIGWAGSTISDSDEWLELTNLSDQTVDLTGWSIAGAATGGDVLVLPEMAGIEANSTYLISNYADDDEKSTLNVLADFVTPSLSLSNSAFGISLQNATGQVVDVAGTGSAPTTGSRGVDEEGEAEPRASMQRFYLIDGSVDETWVSATESLGFDEGATELGTPGTLETFETHATIETINQHTYDAYQNDSSTEDDDTSSEDTTTTTDSTDTTNTNSGTLMINEFVSDPVTGSNEWVEIYNPSETIIILAGYQIREASGKTTELPDQYLASGQYVVVEKISGNLNNSGDTIELLDADGNLLDKVSYGDGAEAPAVSDPKAVALNENGEWVETTMATPGEENVISDQVQEVVEAVEVVETTETADETLVASETLTLQINEFVSDPVTGSKEWVEIYNPNNYVVVLDGWMIREESGKTTALTEGQIETGQFVLVESISGSLNNSGDTIELLDPDGNVIDSVTYGGDSEVPAVSDPDAVALDSAGVWQTTTVATPGEVNVISDVEQEVEEVEEVLEVVEAIEAEDETSVTLETIETLLYDLRLSEIYANTEGADADEEFIEITNTGSESINLLGWSLTDASDKTFTVNDSQMIEPGAFVALYRETTNLALNNSGTESVVLSASDGTVVDQMTYDSTSKGQSFILVDSAWLGTNEVTPNEPNQLSQAEVQSTTTTTVTETAAVSKTTPTTNKATSVVLASGSGSSTSSYSTSTSIVETSLSSVRTLSSGTKVRVTGTVSAEPGLLGKQIMYLAGSGIQVYLYAANWPDVNVGDVVQVTGEMSSSRSESRIKLASANDLVVLSSGDEPVPHEIELEEINDDTEGWLVMISGMISSIESDRFELEDSGTTTTVIIKDETNIDLNSLELGSRVQVTGIVSRYYDSFRVLPRSANDIELLESAVLGTAGTSSKDQAAAGRSGYALTIVVLA
ncbi:MAG: lamin tail domain-containing protein, partial [Candidatus Uhrbacteria bacterium]